jgi:two-component system chemotaxis response regulator CheB
MFHSVAESFGEKAVCVLLTGMGKDGAEEMKMIKDKGAVTVAQDQDSSVVHGMPGEAIRIGGATFILPPEKIASRVTELIMGRRKGHR